jgi:Sec-independent protein translocase protein TatA
MFKKMQGASLVEWIVVVVVVVAVLGAAAMGIVTIASGRAGAAGTWINGLVVPTH